MGRDVAYAAHVAESIEHVNADLTKT
jgi:hypothetical protein